MIRTQIQLTDQQVRLLRRAAEAQGVSMAEIIRRCIDAAVEAQIPSREDAYPRAASLVGAFRDPTAEVAERHDTFLEEAFD